MKIRNLPSSTASWKSKGLTSKVIEKGGKIFLVLEFKDPYGDWHMVIGAKNLNLRSLARSHRRYVLRWLRQ